jgi:DNA mismatch endonuclease (patch repair protein)
MADVFVKSLRAEVMRSVKSSKNKSTELKLIAFFKESGIKGWRRNYNLPGKPDFTFPQMKLVLFADGCFWHGHNCRNLRPGTNKDYWDRKINRNRERDSEITVLLESREWKVIRIWECNIREKYLNSNLSFLIR